MKYTILALLLAVPGLGFAQTTNYEIKGKLVGVDDVRMVYLLRGAYRASKPTVVDSAAVSDNAYTLRGFVTVGQRALLTAVKIGEKTPAVNSYVDIFISPETFSVTHSGTFSNKTITGSPANEAYLQMTKAAKPYNDKIIALAGKMFAELKAKDTTAANGISARIDTLTAECREEVYGDFLRKNPKSPLAFYALQLYGGNDHAIDGQKLKPFFDRLPEDVKASEAGKDFGKRIDVAITFANKSAIGSKATDFVLPDTAGKQVRLSDFKGKYVLLDFWASWCGPCRADNPHLVAAYKQFHQKGFEILSVSCDKRSQRPAWLKAISHDGLTAWTHVADLDHDQNTVVVLYGIQGIPQNFLIGPDGKILAISLRGGDLEKQLNKILNK